MWDAYWEHAQILTYCSGTTAAAVTVGWASLRGTCALEITAQSPNGGRNIWAPKPTGSHWILVPSSTSRSYFNQPTNQPNKPQVCIFLIHWGVTSQHETIQTLKNKPKEIQVSGQTWFHSKYSFLATGEDSDFEHITKSSYKNHVCIVSLLHIATSIL